jgi:hypothetical protein
MNSGDYTQFTLNYDNSPGPYEWISYITANGSQQTYNHGPLGSKGSVKIIRSGGDTITVYAKAYDDGEWTTLNTRTGIQDVYTVDARVNFNCTVYTSNPDQRIYWDNLVVHSADGIVCASSSSSSISSSSSSVSSSSESSSSSSESSSSSSVSSSSSSESSSSSSSSSLSSSSESSSSSSISSSSLSSSSESSSSSSSFSETPGGVAWGHDTGVSETYVRDFNGNWTEDDNAVITGSGDGEELTLNCITSTSISETWFVGVGSTQITINKYGTGSGIDPIIQYKTGTTKAGCDADTWNLYNGSEFTSTGWAKVKVIKS